MSTGPEKVLVLLIGSDNRPKAKTRDTFGHLASNEIGSGERERESRWTPSTPKERDESYPGFYSNEDP